MVSGVLGELNTRKALFLLISPIGVLVIDQLSKGVALRLLKEGHKVELIGNLLKLNLVFNEGSAFGLKLLSRGGYIIITFLLLALMFKLALKRDDPLSLLGYGFILGGALGNLMDRVARGYVVDFISVLNFPIFNVADIFITLGVIVIGISYLIF